MLAPMYKNITVHQIKVKLLLQNHEGVEVHLHSVFVLMLNGGEWSA